MRMSMRTMMRMAANASRQSQFRPTQPDFWFSPLGAGSQNGLTPGNARPVSHLTSVIAANGGAIYGLLNDAGAYPVTGSGSLATIAVSGTALDPILIRGTTPAGKYADIIMEGERTDWTKSVSEQIVDTTGWTPGLKTPFQLNSGAGHVHFRGIDFRRIGGITDAAGVSTGASACILVNAATVEGLKISYCKTYNVRRLFDMTADAALIAPQIYSNIGIGHTKNWARIRGATVGGEFSSNYVDSAWLDGDRFAQCLSLEGTTHDFLVAYNTLMNCFDSYAHRSGATVTYNNGDGIAAEIDTYNLTIRDNVISGHSDGGVDIKSTTGLIFERNRLFDNNKNARFWGPIDAPVFMDDCELESPHRRGTFASGPQQVHITGGADANTRGALVFMRRGHITGGGKIQGAPGNLSSLVQIEGDNAHFRAIDVTIENPNGASNSNDSPATSTIDTTGTEANTATPVLLTSTTQTQYRGSEWTVTLDADFDTMVWRITGGADADDFVLSGETLTLAARTDLTTKSVEITGWNKHGRSVTETINVSNAALIWASNRGEQPTSLAPASVAYCVSKIRFKTGNEPVAAPRCVFVGYWLKDSGTSDYGAESTTGFAAYTVRGHGIEWAGQAYTKSADGSQVISAGTFHVASPFEELTIPANTFYWVTTFLEYTVGQNRPLTYYPHTTNSEGVTYTSTLSVAQAAFDNAAPANGNTTNAHGPSFIFGRPVNGPVPSIALITDSIGTGFNDDEFVDGVSGRRLGGDASGNRGYVRRAFHGIQGYAIANFGRAGAMIGGSYGAGAALRRQIMDLATSHIVVQVGENDIALGTSGMQTALAALYADWDTLGFPMYHLGLSPLSTGTYTTLAGQTAQSVALRDTMFDWEEDQVIAGVLAGAWDPRTVLSPQPASNPRYGVWIADSVYGTGVAHVSDGKHQNHLGAKVGADGLAAVDLIGDDPTAPLGFTLLAGADGRLLMGSDGAYLYA
jgi:hypothetical protein